MATTPTLNERAQRLADHLAANAASLRVAVQTVAGARLIDCGVQTEGGLQAGLAMARGRKASAYARGGIADYWIVNLIDRVLEIHREPAPPGPARRRWGYAAIERLGADAAVTPRAAPAARIAVADLLP